MKIIILNDMVANVEGASVPLKGGETVDLPKSAADMLLKAGFAEKPKPKRKPRKKVVEVKAEVEEPIKE